MDWRSARTGAISNGRPSSCFNNVSMTSTWHSIHRNDSSIWFGRHSVIGIGIHIIVRVLLLTLLTLFLPFLLTILLYIPTFLSLFFLPLQNLRIPLWIPRTESKVTPSVGVWLASLVASLLTLSFTYNQNIVPYSLIYTCLSNTPHLHSLLSLIPNSRTIRTSLLNFTLHHSSSWAGYA